MVGLPPISVSQQRRNRKRQQSFNKLAFLGAVAIGGAVAGAGMGAGAGAGTGAGTGTGAGAIACAIAGAIATGASLISSSLGGGGVALAASGWMTTICSAPLVGSLACKRAVQYQRMAVAPGFRLLCRTPHLEAERHVRRSKSKSWQSQEFLKATIRRKDIRTFAFRARKKKKEGEHFLVFTDHDLVEGLHLLLLAAFLGGEVVAAALRKVPFNKGSYTCARQHFWKASDHDAKPWPKEEPFNTQDVAVNTISFAYLHERCATNPVGRTCGCVNGIDCVTHIR